MFGSNILLLVPHPDDEVVASAAAIGLAKAKGARITALPLTHGCIAKETLWPWDRKNYAQNVALRRKEAEDVARLLGIDLLPNTERPARALWRELDRVFEQTARVIEARGIDQIWVPAYEGGNADHDGANALGTALSRRFEKTPSASVPFVLEFAEYNFLGGKCLSQAFPFPNGSETVHRLSEAERAVKKKALALYASEQGNLNYVETAQESFRPLALADYAHPPHPGKLWYARFQWVPFRHPRVDFTNPQEVCETILRFLEKA